MRLNILMPIMIFMTRYYNNCRTNNRINSVPKHLTTIFRFSLFALLTFFISSCEKGILKMGNDLLPADDFVSVKSIDTLSVFSYTMFDDSVRTDNPTKSYLGENYDPYFGTTTAGFVSQLRLNSQWDEVPITVDSVKLYLHILTTSGLQTGVHKLRLTEIADQIYTDSAYYSSNTRTPVRSAGYEITDIVLPVLRTDTINDIELTLPGNGIDFGNHLFRNPAMLFHSNTTPDFRSYFKGLYFQMDPTNEPLLLSLTLVSDLTNYYNYFVLFGHAADGTVKEYSFILDAQKTNAAFNKYAHDYTTATLGDKMAHRNTTYRDTLSYLQSLDGVYTRVSLPGLQKLKNDATFIKYAINKARLIVPFKFTPTATDDYITKTLPASLRLRYRTSTGVKIDVPDYTMGGSYDSYHDFFDGYIDTVAMVYRFNIPAFVQGYLQDATNSVKPELDIYQGAGLKNVVLKANKNNTPVKFEFTYTKF
jgi:hypothetical protein